MHRWHMAAGDFGSIESSVFGTGCSGSMEGFVADCLPFVRCILPSVESLPSLPTRMVNCSPTGAMLSADDQEQLLLLEEQKQVLQLDDITEFDEEEGVSMRPVLQRLPGKPRYVCPSPSQQENMRNTTPIANPDS